MHFSHYNVFDAMYIRCVQILLKMDILKYISMSSVMHIVLIVMYVQCSINAHTMYILVPYKCTLNAHCNVHWFFATLHLKYWLMYIWCALRGGTLMYFLKHFSHCNDCDAMYISCTHDLLTTYTIKYISMSCRMHIIFIAMYVLRPLEVQ
jgi:hypothetical protein